jgi:hypothetical protein
MALLGKISLSQYLNRQQVGKDSTCRYSYESIPSRQYFINRQLLAQLGVNIYQTVSTADSCWYSWECISTRQYLKSRQLLAQLGVHIY